MQAKSKKEINLWLGICRAQAFWGYFKDNNAAPEQELAWYFEQNSST